MRIMRAVPKHRIAWQSAKTALQFIFIQDRLLHPRSTFIETEAHSNCVPPWNADFGKGSIRRLRSESAGIEHAIAWQPVAQLSAALECRAESRTAGRNHHTGEVSLDPLR
jgi:hypothetical protein